MCLCCLLRLCILQGYINSTYSKTGYWFSILSVVLATLIMSLINIEVSKAKSDNSSVDRDNP